MGMISRMKSSAGKYQALLKSDPSGKLYIEELLKNVCDMSDENFHLPKSIIKDYVERWSKR